MEEVCELRESLVLAAVQRWHDLAGDVQAAVEGRSAMAAIVRDVPARRDRQCGSARAFESQTSNTSSVEVAQSMRAPRRQFMGVMSVQQPANTFAGVSVQWAQKPHRVLEMGRAV